MENKGMGKYTQRYKITIPKNKRIKDFVDMFRYSGDWIENQISNTEYICRHHLQHRQRGMKFFKTQIIKRWKSFGAEIELLDIVKSSSIDKSFRFQGEVPIIVEEN